MNKSNWDKKINRQRKVNQEIFTWYKKRYDESATLLRDTVTGNKGTVIIKEDRMCHQTGYYALESITEAQDDDLLVLVDWEYVVIIPVKGFNKLLDTLEVKKIKNGKILIPRHKVLDCLFAEVMERWFPIYDG